MALLVGIDEAGYGPHLGPLVVAGAAFEFSGVSAPPDANLWGVLRSHVRRRVGGQSERVVICDSKQAFTGRNRDAGLAVLERTVLGFLAASGFQPKTLADLLEVAAVPATEFASTAGPWHQPEALALPAQATRETIEQAAVTLGKGLAAIGGRAGGLWINLTPAARFNRLIDEGQRNKASALFTITAELLAEIRRRHPREGATVMMDQHGGRRRYADLLAGAFPMDRVETIAECADGSRYRLGDAGAPLDLTICEKCESVSLPTALASMAAKYVRELAMSQFNAYFRSRVPELKPTAGYGLDARRFLDEILAAQATTHVAPETLVRSR